MNDTLKHYCQAKQALIICQYTYDNSDTDTQMTNCIHQYIKLFLEIEDGKDV